MMIQNEGDSMTKEEPIAGEMPIPPVAQNIMIKIVRFILGRASLLFLIPAIPLLSGSFPEGNFVFNEFSVMSLVLITAFCLFYFRYRKNVLHDFEKGMKSVRFDLTDAKVINIGFKRKDQDLNLKK